MTSKKSKRLVLDNFSLINNHEKKNELLSKYLLFVLDQVGSDILLPCSRQGVARKPLQPDPLEVAINAHLCRSVEEGANTGRKEGNHMI